MRPVLSFSLLFVLLLSVIMTEDTQAFRVAETLAETLESKVVKIFDEMESLPLSFQKKGIEVRTKWEGNTMLTLSEAKDTPYHPSQIKSFLENFNRDFPKVNPMAQKCHPLAQQGSIRSGVKTELKFPFPLTRRLMIHWVYTKLDRNPDEHMVFLSEQDNDDLLQDNYTDHDKKKFVLARTFLCAYWVKPIHDQNQKVVGSSIRYAFSGDTGGIIPKFVQNTVGPQSAYDSIHGLLNFVADKK